MSAKQKYFRVLVVDNHEADRTLMMLRLGEVWPFEHELVMETAVDGHEALQKMLTQRFSLVLLDLNLPDMDGQTILRELRSRGNWTTVLVVSGREEASVTPHLSDFGVAFLSKDSLSSERFTDAIDTALKQQGEAVFVASHRPNWMSLPTPEVVEPSTMQGAPAV